MATPPPAGIPAPQLSAFKSHALHFGSSRLTAGRGAETLEDGHPQEHGEAGGYSLPTPVLPTAVSRRFFRRLEGNRRVPTPSPTPPTLSRTPTTIRRKPGSVIVPLRRLTSPSYTQGTTPSSCIMFADAPCLTSRRHQCPDTEWTPTFADLCSVGLWDYVPMDLLPPPPRPDHPRTTTDAALRMPSQRSPTIVSATAQVSDEVRLHPPPDSDPSYLTPPAIVRRSSPSQRLGIRIPTT
ncbi:hypothetical protein GALMADRAFT_148813 [Galerina marginata CBS 339.88]|uniref:Uncharacterized protein n=1 Tax=Galerina marginata (strain CBS 339.88) TaxID=685588 RepID=A0A067SET8_GALM3|nr:hypothetical protein GALMADRAFT_148813 [Galerina marginata CBS 339.88]